MFWRKAATLLLAVVMAAAGWWKHFQPAQAGRGTPGSAEFGYGAVIELDGPYLSDALAMATDLPLDWLAISLDWSAYDAPAGTTAVWQKLDRVMAFADHENLPVLFKLKSAPGSALESEGPSPAKTAAFVAALAKRYPALQAVELFPNANLRTGWGRQPNPLAYLRLYRAVQAELRVGGRELVLVAGGFKPVEQTRVGEAVNDLEFARALFAASKDAPLPVISLDLSDIHSDPLASPEGDPAVLREYEKLREEMTRNSHQKSLIWIDAFRAPSGTIEASGPNSSLKTIVDPVNWLNQAFAQLRSQLYIGVVFYQSLNPAGTGNQNNALIKNEHEYHPFYLVFRELIAQNAPEARNHQKGRPKDERFSKKIP